MKKGIKWLGVLAAFLLFCAATAMVNHNSETLADYAEREPELAYMVQETEGAETEETQEKIEAETTLSEAAAPPAEQTPEAAGQQSAAYTSLSHTAENGESEMSEIEICYERTTYQPGFYYEPLSEDMKKRITGLSYKEDCPVPYDDLRYVSVLYVNFKGNVSTGEIICNKAIAQDLTEIFYELYQANYQIEQIRLVDEYNADDNLSMQDNNTSCFNYRTVAGTNRISMHGQGLAIDINPFFNPYITYRNGGQQVAPAGAEAYADRSQPFAYKIDENDLCYKLFTEHGFSWGGNWNNSKDYQHFEKKIK